MPGLIEYVKDRTETNLLPHLLVMIERVCLCMDTLLQEPSTVIDSVLVSFLSAETK